MRHAYFDVFVVCTSVCEIVTPWAFYIWYNVSALYTHSRTLDRTYGSSFLILYMETKARKISRVKCSCITAIWLFLTKLKFWVAEERTIKYRDAQKSFQVIFYPLCSDKIQDSAVHEFWVAVTLWHFYQVPKKIFNHIYMDIYVCMNVCKRGYRYFKTYVGTIPSGITLNFIYHISRTKKSTPAINFFERGICVFPYKHPVYNNESRSFHFERKSFSSDVYRVSRQSTYIVRKLFSHMHTLKK